MRIKVLSLLLVLTMVASFMPSIAIASTYSSKIAESSTVNVEYDDNGVSKNKDAIPLISGDYQTLTTGWYVVQKNEAVNISGLAVADGEIVNLILEDDCTLNAISIDDDFPGIRVEGSSTLNIYAQSTGTGKIEAKGGISAAGIGGGSERHCGTVTINGGIINIVNSKAGAGIGGGFDADGGTVTINGGNVNISTSNVGQVIYDGESIYYYTYGAGIGGGQNGDGGTVTINGGTVTLTVYTTPTTKSSVNSAGIGGGMEGHGGTVTINGGTVNVTGRKSGAAIGGGPNGNGANVVITGGSVNAISTSASSIGSGITYGDALDNGTLVGKDGTPIYLTTIELSDIGENAPITNMEILNVSDYGLKDVVTDSENKIYLYLPSESIISSITADGNEYLGSNPLTVTSGQNSATFNQYQSPKYNSAKIKDATNYKVLDILELELDGFIGGYSTEGEPSYQWKRATNENKSTDVEIISGATASTYKTTSKDFGKYVWCEVTPEDSIGTLGQMQSTNAVRIGILAKVTTTGGNGAQSIIVEGESVGTGIMIYADKIDISVTPYYDSDSVLWESVNFGTFTKPNTKSTQFALNPNPELNEINLTAKLTSATLNGEVKLSIDKNTGVISADTSGVSGGNGDFNFSWSGTGVTDSKTNTLAQSDSHLGNEIKVTVTRPGVDGSKSATIKPYKVNLTKVGNSDSDSATIDNPYGVVGDTVSIAYTLNSSGMYSNGISFANVTISPVSVAGSGTSSYVISEADATNGTINITATFNHLTSLEGKPVISTYSPMAGDIITILTLPTNGGTSFTYLWESTNGNPLKNNATGNTYTVDSEDIGKPIRLTVTSTDSSLAGSQTSDITAAVIDNKYSLTVVGGGNGSTTSTSYIVGSKVSLYSGTRSGYNFSGWKSSEVVINDNSFTMPTKNVIVEAKWTKVKSSGSNSSQRYQFMNSGSTTESTNPFGDISKNDWFYDSVQFVSINGLMNGTDLTTFEPYTNVTRAMFVTILYRAENQPNTGLASFADVERGSYYEKAVAWATQVGVVNGVSNEEFAPNNSITREQMASMIQRYMLMKELENNNNTTIDYLDKEIISDYAKNAVNFCAEHGIMNGKQNNIFAPLDFAPRSEVAAVIERLIKLAK